MLPGINVIQKPLTESKAVKIQVPCYVITILRRPLTASRNAVKQKIDRKYIIENT